MNGVIPIIITITIHYLRTTESSCSSHQVTEHTEEATKTPKPPMINVWGEMRERRSQPNTSPLTTIHGLVYTIYQRSNFCLVNLPSLSPPEQQRPCVESKLPWWCVFHSQNSTNHSLFFHRCKVICWWLVACSSYAYHQQSRRCIYGTWAFYNYYHY